MSSGDTLTLVMAVFAESASGTRSSLLEGANVLGLDFDHHAGEFAQAFLEPEPHRPGGDPRATPLGRHLGSGHGPRGVPHPLRGSATILRPSPA